MILSFKPQKAPKTNPGEFPTISEVLSSFDDHIVEALKKVPASFDKKVVMGYDMVSFNARKSVALTCISAINELLDLHVELFKDKTRNRHLVEEVITLLKCGDTAKQMTELKIRYMRWYNIGIPNFPGFKLSSLIEAYDFPAEHDVLFAKIASGLLLLPNIELDQFVSNFVDSESKLVFTAEDENNLLKKCTRFATREELSEILSLHMACTGLSNIRKSGYRFDELPEIDHRLMSKIAIDPSGESISVDFDKLNGEGIESRLDDVEIIFTGINDLDLPVFTINGKRYEIRSPRVKGLFESGKVTDFTVLKNIEHREDLIKAIIRMKRLGSGALKRLPDSN